jgi:hypothetical protein
MQYSSSVPAGDETLPLENRKPGLKEAESLFLSIVDAPGLNKNQRLQVSRRVSEPYTAWHALEPDKGYDKKAAEWQAKVAEYQASTQPAPQPTSDAVEQ